jgi:hypothetical protein
VPLLTRRLLDHLEHEDIEECEIYWQGGEAMIMGPAWFADAGKLMDSAAALVNLVACTTQSGSISLQGKPLSAYVRMTQVQAAYLGSGSAGNGVLRYKGSSYPFSVGGLGVGGIGLYSRDHRCARSYKSCSLGGLF